MKQFSEKIKIVLADDDKEDQELFEEAFKSVCTKNELAIFDSGIELLSWLEKSEDVPDLLFLDLNMPLMDGVECLQEIRRNPAYQNLAIAIYSTSSLERDIEETSLLCGANIYITKPADFNVLKQIIQKILRINLQYKNGDFDMGRFLFSL